MGCFITDKANCGIEELAPVEAYFLGGILMSSGEHSGSGPVFTIKFNFKPAIEDKDAELNELNGLLGELAKIAGGDSPYRINGHPSGLAVQFRADGGATETTLRLATKIMNSEDPDLMRAVLAGAYDSKATIDTSSKMLVVDCPEENQQEISAIIRELCSKQGIQLIQDNSSRQRDPAKPRKMQLRMNQENALKFYANVGLLSPLKLRRACNCFGDGKIIEREREIVPGLKVIEWESVSSQDEGRPTQEPTRLPANDGANDSTRPQGNTQDNAARAQAVSPISKRDAERYQRYEGQVMKRIVGEYSRVRDSGLRDECLKRKGTRCYVCGFDSYEVYGIPGIVDVHHLTPLSVGEGRITDVDADLVPLCPNCHRAIHSDRNTPCGLYELDALKERLRQSKCE